MQLTNTGPVAPFLALLTLSLAMTAQAQGEVGRIKNVVLVHGAWADGSSWAGVIPILQKKGLNVVAVQNPVLGLAEDTAFVRRALATVEGPTLLVGHSWGGMMVTEAGDDPKVVGLVYVSCPPLDVGESLASAAKGYPPAPGGAEVKPGGGGFLILSQAGVEKHFALDLPRSGALLVWAVQGDSAPRFATDTITVAAWKSRPSWSVIGKRDHMLDPQMLQDKAKKAGAKVTVIDASHVVMISQPKAVAEVILRAAAEASAHLTAR
jgi:pimeloyl-ACP methyl ester carboxylesterase